MKSEVRLIPVTETIERGNIRREPQRNRMRRVLARVGSIGEREFYDSVQAGYDLSLRVEVWTADYRNEKMLLYGGEEYNVVRTYQNERRRTELYCEKVKGRE